MAYRVKTDVFEGPFDLLLHLVSRQKLDIMEIEGKPMAKRGKRSGAKQVWRLPGAFGNIVLAAGKPAPVDAAGRSAEALLKPLIKGGKIIRDLPPPRTLRDYVIEQMARIELAPARERGLRGDY